MKFKFKRQRLVICLGVFENRGAHCDYCFKLRLSKFSYFVSVVTYLHLVYRELVSKDIK